MGAGRMFGDNGRSGFMNCLYCERGMEVTSEGKINTCRDCGIRYYDLFITKGKYITAMNSRVFMMLYLLVV